jgi:hypothetical protein
MVRFRDVIDVDCPRAMAQLDRMLRALDAYRQVASPTGDTGGDGAAGGANVTRQLDEQGPVPAAAAPVTPDAAVEGESA